MATQRVIKDSVQGKCEGGMMFRNKDWHIHRARKMFYDIEGVP